MAEPQIPLNKLPTTPNLVSDQNSGGNAVNAETSGGEDVCKICHSGRGESSDSPLIAPCLCAGSIKYVHQGRHSVMP